MICSLLSQLLAPTTLSGEPLLDEAAPQVVQAKRVSNRAGNRMGTVLVLMYHKLGPQEKYMVRSYDNFVRDLNRLYKLGYRPVTLAEYGANRMKLPRGASPVVLSFDDSHETQFVLNRDGEPASNSFVGAWAKFAKSHPDFPVKGTFFVLPNGPFGQKLLAKKKLALFKQWGCEVASHSMNHPDFSKLSDSQAISELGRSYDYVKSLGFEPTSMALPYGKLPKNRQLLRTFEYKGETRKYWNTCIAGYKPAPSPLSPKFNRHMIDRVQAYNGIYGINWWLDYNKKYPSSPYVQP
jgi:peptidoglycan/xylan/chitin deacetylase (PgdA/CDA1 family)